MTQLGVGACRGRSNSAGVSAAVPGLYTSLRITSKMKFMENAALRYAPLMAVQFVIMVLYFIFARYGGDKHHDQRGFEDTHVMIFIGFGFLMTFLKKYCYSALGLNWLLAAIVIQWALLCQAFFTMENNTIYVTKESLIEADIMSATVLITFGALLGVASSTQLLFIAMVEVVAACLNFWIVGQKLHAADVGGSMAIHAFGAYFGLGASFALNMGSKQIDTHELNGPKYETDVTAMIGSIFLWIYWPSFNSALTASDSDYQRAVVNTYLSLAAATVTAFVVSSMVNHQKGKFDMVHVQNSTLAGGVAVGAICNMYIGTGGAIAVGIGAGFLSVLGYAYLTPRLNKLNILDTCGVNNLHGMPGVYSGLLSVLFAALATVEVYGTDLHGVFSQRQNDGGGITAGAAALNQLFALISTMVISIVSGVIAGFIAKLPLFASLTEEEKYNDEPNWELP